MKLAAPLALALSVSSALAAQTTFTDPANLRGERVKPLDGRELPIDQGSRGLQQLLRKLNTRASLMLIVAHPDDEDGGMLTYYSRGLGARVAVLTLTRGEGGQNAMTGDFGDALGLLRTQELLSADRYLGVDQFFGTEVDFGFSKTKEEAFRKWTHERVLYDAVRAIRLYRPLVIAAVFVGGVTDGHGQHQVSGQIAQEAFKAAGDPTVFPDMIAEGILPWQPLKVYARVPMQAITSQGLYDYATGQYTPARFTNYVTGEVTTIQPSVDVVVHEGQTDLLLSPAAANHADLPTGLAAQPPDTALSYVQFGRIGLGLQRSQIGPGVRNAPPGKFDIGYHLYGSASSLGAQANRQNAQLPANDAGFFNGIDTSIEGIATLATTPFPPLQHVLETVSARIKTATEAVNAGKVNASATQLARALQSIDQAIVRIQEFELTPGMAKQNILHELLIKRVQLNDALVLVLGVQMEATTQSATIHAGTSPEVHLTVRTTFSQGVHYFNERIETSGGNVGNGPIHSPDTKITPVHPWIDTLKASTALTHQPTWPYFSRTNIEEPVYQLNDASLRNAPATSPAITAWIRISYNGTDLRIGHVVTAGTQPVSIVPAGPEGTYRALGYGDLPRTNYMVPPPKRVATANLTLPARRRIAYLPGTGDAVPEALASIGLTPTVLTVADLKPARLANFDTVILGVRTYSAHPELHGTPTEALLNFARNGGNVVVQYQTYEFTSGDAPYPLSLGSNEKVVDETAPVQLLETTNPLLTVPNKISSADFDNWVEERGHGFLGSWDTHYTALTETHDPGSEAEHIAPQAPQRGGIVTTQFGKGRWTYCAFALYRQLPEAVSGAFRLFLNLITP